MSFHPTNNPVFWKTTADNLLADERYEKAAEAYLRLTELLPSDADAWKGRGYALFGLEKYGDAVSAFEMALILLPDDKFSLEKLAECFDKLGASEKRTACLIRLSEL
jgi:tetratricopeptide (TPR) repeat protein